MLSSALHGEALLTAQRPELQPLIDHLAERAQAPDDIQTEWPGTIRRSLVRQPGPAGSPADRSWHVILAAGGRGTPLDYSELERRTRVGYERGSAARRGER